MKILLTRNPRDYKNASLIVQTPETFLVSNGLIWLKIVMKKSSQEAIFHEKKFDIYNIMQYIAYMLITNDQILGMMPPQSGLFGLLFAFMNRLQSAGDSFYEEITCKQ